MFSPPISKCRRGPVFLLDYPNPKGYLCNVALVTLNHSFSKLAKPNFKFSELQRLNSEPWWTRIASVVHVFSGQLLFASRVGKHQLRKIMSNPDNWTLNHSEPCIFSKLKPRTHQKSRTFSYIFIIPIYF